MLIVVRNDMFFMFLNNTIEIENRAGRICSQTAAEVCRFYCQPGNFFITCLVPPALGFVMSRQLKNITIHRNVQKRNGFTRICSAKSRKCNCFRYF